MFVIAGSIFMLVRMACMKSWTDFDFAARKEKKKSSDGPYLFTEFKEDGVLSAADHLYQRLRLSSFWFVTSSHIVLGAILVTLVSGIALYATGGRGTNPELPEKWIWFEIASRVGIVVLVLFLVQILVPLYQYLLRLHVSCSARADALLLCALRPDQLASGDEDIEKLAEAVVEKAMNRAGMNARCDEIIEGRLRLASALKLMHDEKLNLALLKKATAALTLEKIPFGKPPRSPMRDVTELLKAVQQKEPGKSHE
jgi:hypothetical protein